MADWLRQQEKRASALGYTFRAPPAALPDAPTYELDPIDARIAAAAERLRELQESGEIEWTDVHPLAAYEMAFLDE